MTTADKILGLLQRAEYVDCPPSAREAADRLSLPTGTVSAALRKLESAGRVEKAGVTFSGGRTWKLAEEPQS